jgi:hypothetical protein
MKPPVRAYPELSLVLGSASAVPDFRGLFLRGFGSQSHAQNNGTTVGETSTLHASGSLGDVQGDAARRLTGAIEVSLTDSPESMPDTGAFTTARDDSSQQQASSSPLWDDIIILDSARVTPTAAEYRPVNTAVRFLIRALP